MLQQASFRTPSPGPGLAGKSRRDILDLESSRGREPERKAFHHRGPSNKDHTMNRKYLTGLKVYEHICIVRKTDPVAIDTTDGSLHAIAFRPDSTCSSSRVLSISLSIPTSSGSSSNIAPCLLNFHSSRSIRPIKM
jgi:hypothetical protein